MYFFSLERSCFIRLCFVFFSKPAPRSGTVYHNAVIVMFSSKSGAVFSNFFISTLFLLVFFFFESGCDRKHIFHQSALVVRLLYVCIYFIYCPNPVPQSLVVLPIRTLLKKEGAGALYKGMAPAMLRAFPANAACFFGVDFAKSVLGSAGM